MRTTTTAYLSLLVGSTIGCAQLGHPGGRTHEGPDAGTEQATCDQVETKTMDLAFAGSDMSYAGLPTSCWKLQGKLTISGSVSSLAKLGDLREVQDLEINGGALTTIDTTSALKVTRTINIHDTTKLADLGKLDIAQDQTCLSYLASVSVVANSALTDLKNLQNVTCVAGAFTIQDNTKLTTVSMSKVQSITHGTALDAIVIRHNAALTSINMNGLQYLHGSMTIDNNAALTTIGSMTTTFPAIEGALTITGNTALTDLGTLDHSPGVLSGITITGNTALPYCQARHVGCCVSHSGTAQIGQGNTNCGSWCTDQHNCYSTTN